MIPVVRGSATIHINAPVGRVWPLISDVTQIGRFSPETFEAEWLDGVSCASEGARFRGHVKRNEKGPVYWTECTVVSCVPEREFAFAVRSRPFGLPIGPRNVVELTWSYTLQAATDGGTEVTETFEFARTIPMRLYWTLLGWARGDRNQKDMRRTLEAIKLAAES
jgi:uncharacterized protein YndB with AHSA1/START domain